MQRHFLSSLTSIPGSMYLQREALSCSPAGDQALRELPSPGKSGSVFFLSADDKFIIKTMRKVTAPAVRTASSL